MLVIEAVELWKRFRIPHVRRHTILEHVAGFLSVLEGERYDYEEFWALKGVSFKVGSGESLGVIGPNGSGKSTLLKLMANVMRPDKGRVEANGRVVPILELGIGFQGDLTIKENALVYGVVMGIGRTEMRKRIGQVLEFADLTKFQDAKLKTLSSGMQVRLAFSIAVQTNADVFLVDEALAVGDIEFQQKCLDKFREFKRDGKSIVFVSHDMDLVKEFCEKTLYMVHGEVRALGLSDGITSQFIDDTKSAFH